MKLLEGIIKTLPDRENDRYIIDIKKILYRLSDYETDIPDEIYYKSDQRKSMGAAFEYLDSLEDIKFICVPGFAPRGCLGEGFYTNNAGKVSHDFYLTMAVAESRTFVTIQINNTDCDPRCYSEEMYNNNSYSDAILFEFEDESEFYDALQEAIEEETTFSITVGNRKYFITPQIGTDVLLVRYYDGNGELIEIQGISSTSDDEFRRDIKIYNKVKRKQRKNK